MKRGGKNKKPTDGDEEVGGAATDGRWGFGGGSVMGRVVKDWASEVVTMCGLGRNK